VSERWDGTWVIYPKAHTVADMLEARHSVVVKIQKLDAPLTNKPYW
jgi:hypothetical protein